MKKSLLVILGCIVAVAMFSFTFLDNDQQTVINALNTGDANKVVSYFDDVLDIKLPNKDEGKNIGKNQAGMLFKAFYNDNDISNFSLTSQREMGSTMYIAGKLTGKGQAFNITLMLHNRNGKSSIFSVRIN